MNHQNGGNTCSRYFFYLDLVDVDGDTHTFLQQMGGWPSMMSIFFRGANIFQNPPIVKHYNNGFPHGSFFISISYLPTKIAQGICQIWQRWWYPKAAIISSWLPWHQCPGKSHSKIDPHGFFEFHPCCLDTISNKWSCSQLDTKCRMRPVGVANSFFADPAEATHDS